MQPSYLQRLFVDGLSASLEPPLNFILSPFNDPSVGPVQVSKLGYKHTITLDMIVRYIEDVVCSNQFMSCYWF